MAYIGEKSKICNCPPDTSESKSKNADAQDWFTLSERRKKGRLRTKEALPLQFLEPYAPASYGRSNQNIASAGLEADLDSHRAFGLTYGTPRTLRIADWFIVACQGHFGYVGGTSVSSATFASIISTVDNTRVSITAGYNPGCGTEAFNASTHPDLATAFRDVESEKLREPALRPL
ncbi:hypothetical protein BKA83DRAFT_4125769 [Pisolithus microcarpus]|nr:hypothetical protein BKA83DRAFT_4125769 [Pisolithus microcarpus]